MTRPILYIHGFASSGHSTKGQILKAHFAEAYTPSLSHIPDLAVETLEELIRALHRPLLVGSSLGGYYALHLALKHQLPAVLINPVVHIDHPLTSVVGMNKHYYDGSRFEFSPDHLRSLAGYYVEQPPLQRLLLLVQLADEVLDQQQTLHHLEGVQAIVEEGGNHAYQDFEQRIEAIRAFAERQP